MKWLWIIWIVLIGQSVALSQNNNIRLMSYNIRLDHAGDNDDNWHHRKADMVDYMGQNGPDFIGIQEALDHQLKYLANNLSKYDYVGVARDDGAKLGEYSPILYDTTIWKIAETNTFWLSETPNRVSRGWDAVCLRVCTYGLFVHKEDGDSILVLNTHFDHQGKIARKESIHLINEFMHQFEPELPVVLMGDFNFTPDDVNYGALTKYLSDCYSVNNVESTLNATFNGWKFDNQSERRIDYILCNSEVNIKSYKVDHPRTGSQRQLSDHYPVIVEIDIK